jgi:hypothetical protein
MQLAGVAAAVGGKVGKAKEAYDRAMAAALRQQERANRLAEIIASQFQRVKVGRSTRVVHPHTYAPGFMLYQVSSHSAFM